MTLSWKLLFIMLKRNDLVIKTFIATYLVSIYGFFICIYMCAYLYHEYALTWLRACIFVFSLLFGIENDCIILLISHTKF